jgi:hypothetical protein
MKRMTNDPKMLYNKMKESNLLCPSTTRPLGGTQP